MNTEITSLFIAALFIPAFFCGGFYYGFNTAKNVFVNKTVEKENLPFARLWHRNSQLENSAPAETKAQRMARILAENVENYGTDLPQKEVK